MSLVFLGCSVVFFLKKQRRLEKISTRLLLHALVVNTGSQRSWLSIVPFIISSNKSNKRRKLNFSTFEGLDGDDETLSSIHDSQVDSPSGGGGSNEEFQRNDDDQEDEPDDAEVDLRRVDRNLEIVKLIYFNTKVLLCVCPTVTGLGIIFCQICALCLFRPKLHSKAFVKET